MILKKKKKFKTILFVKKKDEKVEKNIEADSAIAEEDKADQKEKKEKT